MATIQKIGVADFERLLEEWRRPTRRIDAIHLHHTWRPRHRDFRGQSTIEAMRRYHMAHAGMCDIAQHLTIDPNGGLWTGRPFEMPPASAAGYNGTRSLGPFMIEMIGDFDKGQDVLQGAQEHALQAVILALLRRFDLDAARVLFHRELDARIRKSCPGTGLDPKKFRARIAELLADPELLVRPPRSDAVLDAETTRAWHGAGARDADDDDPFVGDAAHVEVPEDAVSLERQEFLADLIERGDVAPVAASRGVDFSVHPLLPYVINLSKGVLSTKGDISSSIDKFCCTRSSLREIVERHLPDYIAARKAAGKTPHLVFYAHGGLNNESVALCYARAMLPWWLAHGVYPIFFIWESGLIDTLRSAPRGGMARGWFGDLTDRLLEGLTQRAARKVWSRMKTDAENASLPEIPTLDNRPGGAWLFADMLKPLLEQHRQSLKVHAIGHSTGPILLSKFLPLLHGDAIDAGACRIETLSYLAPAMRTDLFVQRVMPHLQGGAAPRINDLTMYTMTDEAERDDTVGHIYRKSLLYFVREACEDDTRGRILGLARDLFARDDANSRAIAARFGLEDASGGLSFAHAGCALELSPAHDSGQFNERTRADSHGGFDNDPYTMASVLKRILASGTPAETPSFAPKEKMFPGEDAFDRCGVGVSARGDASAADAERGPPCCCCRDKAGAPPERFGDDVDEDDPAYGGHSDDGSGGDADGGAGDTGDAVPAPDGGGGRARKVRRIAVCVGIDKYKSMPLAGCVNDSKRWSKAFGDLGFEVRPLADRKATRRAIVDALEGLIVDAKPGDELVFQYAGHGSQIEDRDGDEAGATGRFDAFDEVFMPVDCDDGELLVDDDFYAITERLPTGAFLTLFMDCCHSGSNSRFAPAQASTRSRGGGDQRKRYMPMRDEVKRAFFAKRPSRKTALRRGGAERLALPGVVHFAACEDREYAWESDGQGDFTRIAVPLLLDAVRNGMNNQTFIDTVVRKFGASPRQHPLMLKPAKGLQKRGLLGGAQ